MNIEKKLDKVDKRIKDDVQELILQLEFMRSKLNESRIALADQPLVIEYDNGGGQSGIRENPEYVAYEKLLASYNRTLSMVESMLGDENETAEITSLSSMRSKIKIAK